MIQLILITKILVEEEEEKKIMMLKEKQKDRIVEDKWTMEDYSLFQKVKNQNKKNFENNQINKQEFH